MATDWPCKGLPTAIFFPEESDTPFHEALDTARGFCDVCPSRAPCLAYAMQAEGSEGVDYRFGIYSGTTPQQRYSLHKREQELACAECGQAYDPIDLRKGTPRCLCGVRNNTKAIPDRGDQWTERHTKLARMTLDWFIKNLAEGDEVLDALKLSKKLKVGVKDMRRVYQAFREDHVIHDGKIRLLAASVDYWLPKHLR